MSKYARKIKQAYNCGSVKSFRENRLLYFGKTFAAISYARLKIFLGDFELSISLTISLSSKGQDRAVADPFGAPDKSGLLRVSDLAWLEVCPAG